MGTYYIPRNVKGEGRILFVFSTKALIYTAIGAAIGGVFYFVLNILGLGIIGFFIIALLGLAGFIIGTFKVPNTSYFKFTQKTAGQNIDDVIKRAIKFKMNKAKYYIYTKEEHTNE